MNNCDIMKGSAVGSGGQAYSLLGANMTPSETEYRTIPLTCGQVALVDLEDYPLVSQYRWQAVYKKNVRKFYANAGSGSI